MLNIDASGISAGQITHQHFVGGRVLKRILFDDGKQFLGFGFQSTVSKL